MKTIYFCFLVLLFSSNLYAKVLTVSTGFNQNEAQYLKKIIQEVFNRVGMDLEFQILPNKHSLVNANSGIGDGEAARIWSINKAYPNLIPIAPNIHTIDIVLISKEGRKIKKLTDLHEYTIGLVRGVKIANTLAKKYNP